MEITWLDLSEEQRKMKSSSNENRRWQLSAVIVYILAGRTRQATESGHYIIYSRTVDGNWVLVGNIFLFLLKPNSSEDQ